MFDIDPASPVPLYLQICHRVRRMIAMGALRSGDRLPAVRELAVQARVNRNTAARAIQHLEGQGVVRTEVGRGTFVEADGDRGDPDREDEFKRWIDRVLVEGRDLGIGPTEVRDLIDTWLDGDSDANAEETQ